MLPVVHSSGSRPAAGHVPLNPHAGIARFRMQPAFQAAQTIEVVGVRKPAPLLSLASSRKRAALTRSLDGKSDEKAFFGK
jgi:hypothetical protein